MEAMPTMMLEVPEPVFRRLQHIAEITNRSIQEVLVATVNVALPSDAELPTEVADELAAMSMFNDDALWAAVESSLSPSQQRRLRQLNETADIRPLTDAEEKELAQLVEAYDRAVLRRARALALLAHRGYDVAPLTEPVATGDDDSQST